MRMVTTPVTPRDVFQQVSTSGSSAQSSAFGAKTQKIMVVATADAYITIGTNPTATSASFYLPAKVPLWFGVQPGEKLAALQVSSGGVVSIAEGIQHP